MKIRKLLFGIITILIGVTLVACNNKPNDVFYNIMFVNYDDWVLLEVSVEKGSLPVFTGDTPTRPSTEDKSYIFTDWSPTIVVASKDTIYKAVFEEKVEKIINSNFKYSINSNKDVLIIENFKYSKDDIEQYEYLLLSEGNLYITNDYLVNLDLGEHNLNLKFENDNYIIDFLIIDTDKPYLINYLDLNYKKNENLVLLLDMLDYEFNSISANEIKASDFKVENNTVTIFSNYLNNQFSGNRENLVFQVFYNEGIDYYNFYITIKK